MHDNLLLFLFLIFSGAAVLSTLALCMRQSLLIAYMVLGVILGPWGLKWVVDSSVIEAIGNIGIIFLLFLLGLHLQPQKLIHTLKKVSWLVLVSSVLTMAIGFVVAYLFGFSTEESTIIGAATMFSSTIIGLKLLPTTVLHHQHTGELMIAVLLLQDLLAILVLLVIHGSTAGAFAWRSAFYTLLALPSLLILAFVIEKFVLRKLFRHFNRIREYLFLLSIAWCLSLSMLASFAGLSAEIGAFIAGVSIASSPIAFYIADSLKPVRDFFLVLFFFAMGASFNLGFFSAIVVPAVILAASVMIAKPVMFRVLFGQMGESPHVAWETSMRLSQLSEFSILVAYVGVQKGLLGATASNLIQLATMLTFIISSYVVIMRYPTPVAMSDKLRRD